ncbi:hypothetical protein [Labrenzia sp. 011]|uniref:hypothetical protein n=1 Tax=Labrenzia sp. 011 TaxID=2171494 RepID=UPI000D51D486|nr:hypothetical protein [Labrenzia sp. 011]PVB62523.1 hypothetical protein DCO57_07165 [Labrenzia sp. 011]
MFATVSKLSAPIAGAMLLVSAGFISTAEAAPRAAGVKGQTAQSELVVQIDHRKGGQVRKGGRGWNRQMDPRQVRRSLRHRGFHGIQIIKRRGAVYDVNARGWRGAPVRLVVDSRTAHIVRSRPITRGHR